MAVWSHCCQVAEQAIAYKWNGFWHITNSGKLSFFVCGDSLLTNGGIRIQMLALCLKMYAFGGRCCAIVRSYLFRCSRLLVLMGHKRRHGLGGIQYHKEHWLVPCFFCTCSPNGAETFNEGEVTNSIILIGQFVIDKWLSTILLT